MQAVELRAGPWRAALRPDLGGSLAGLWWNGEPVLRSTEPAQLEGPRQSAGFAMLPVSNRIGHGRLVWREQEHRLRPNFGEHPHPLHGPGWQRAWTVEAQQADEVTLALQHAPDADWPFGFSATQTLRLDGTGLRWSLALRNTDSREQPAGLGWHPYFLHRPGSHLRAAVTHRWERGDDALPRERRPHPPLDLALADVGLDHGFDGWDGEAWIDDDRQRLRLASSLRRLVVFTPAGAAHFCVEPVSHAINAVQSDDPIGHGLVALPPGAQLNAWMTLERVPHDD